MFNYKKINKIFLHKYFVFSKDLFKNARKNKIFKVINIGSDLIIPTLYLENKKEKGICYPISLSKFIKLLDSEKVYFEISN